MDITTLVLPPHENAQHAVCSGAEVADVTEDVGLSVGICPVCHQSFVYMPLTHEWEPEDMFEKALQSNSASFGSVLAKL
jgi:hypothetical protein